MKVSLRGLAEIASHEAIVLTPYRDSVGVWTIGIGHTAAAGAPDPETCGPLTLDDVMGLFARDIAKFEDGVNRAVKVPLAQHEFDALVSFHFNTGAIGRASLVDKLNAGNRAGAAAGFMAWKKPPEIIGRRTKEMELFRSGVYGNGWATSYRSDDRGHVLWKSAQRVNVLEVLSKTIGAPPKREIIQPANLRRGDRGDKVRVLQANLLTLGIRLVVDADFGPATEQAVKTFQARAGLSPDGIVGPMTAAAIVEALSTNEA
jgi:lysozyme